MKTLTEMLDDVRIATVAYADAYNAKKPDAELKALKKCATDALNAYNLRVSEETYRKWAEEGDAVKQALSRMYIPGAKKITYRPNKTTGVMNATIKDNPRYRCSLTRMQQTIGAEHFHESDWFDKLQALCLMMANAVKSQFGVTDLEYTVSQAAKVFKFADNANLSSNTSATKALQQVVDSILYIPVTDAKGRTVNDIKCKTSHYSYIREILTTGGDEPGDIGIYDCTRVEGLIQDVIYMILNKKGYNLFVVE